MSEIRLRLVKFGATIEDRQRLRISLEEQPTAPDTTTTAVPFSTGQERRQRLANAS